jgi:hypothetical protein
MLLAESTDSLRRKRRKPRAKVMMSCHRSTNHFLSQPVHFTRRPALSPKRKLRVVRQSPPLREEVFLPNQLEEFPQVSLGIS